MQCAKGYSDARKISGSQCYLGLFVCFRPALCERRRGEKAKNPLALANGFFVLATSYSRTTFRRTTIGAAAFHCRVRNGNGWFHCAMITRGPSRTGSSLLLQRRKREAASLGTCGWGETPPPKIKKKHH